MGTGKNTFWNEKGRFKEYFFLFSATLILSKAEFAANINNAIIMFFPTRCTVRGTLQMHRMCLP